MISSVIDGSTIIEIKKYSFYHLNLTSVVIPDTVTFIMGTSSYVSNYGAFSYNQLTYITIQDSVTKIEDGAFLYNNLDYVYIENDSKLSYIGKYAFSSSNVTRSLTGITYVDNPNLKKIYYNGSKALAWIYAINGSNSSNKFVTGTVPSYTSGDTTYNEVLITTGE